MLTRLILFVLQLGEPAGDLIEIGLPAALRIVDQTELFPPVILLQIFSNIFHQEKMDFLAGPVLIDHIKQTQVPGTENDRIGHGCIDKFTAPAHFGADLIFQTLQELDPPFFRNTDKAGQRHDRLSRPGKLRDSGTGIVKIGIRLDDGVEKILHPLPLFR